MVKIVKSEEVKKIIEEDLTEMDKFALTTKGKIKSYQINYNSIRHNPMGGISFTIYVNNDKGMYVFYTISKDSQTGKLGNDGGGNSAKFEKLITGGKVSRAYSNHERQKIAKEEYTNYSVTDPLKIINDKGKKETIGTVREVITDKTG
ncbi:DUF1310 family protein, partial [Streptococcus constellatus]|uniref:DUF1310 family protein n=1 Tax=Streptococcus constellatus TaxID=76860 RepID=UPI0009B98B52